MTTVFTYPPEPEYPPYYYFDPETGVRASGWTKIDGTFQYFKPDGIFRALPHDGRKTNLELAYWSLNKLGCPYWYGTFGNLADKRLYEFKKNQYPRYYKAKDYVSQYGRQVFDCVGLIKGFLWSDTSTDDFSEPVYTPQQDVSSKGMYYASWGQCGRMDTCPFTVGTLLYKSNNGLATGIHHVGVYVGSGLVMEAKGHQWGTILTPLYETTSGGADDPDAGTSWDFWSQCPWITDNGIYDPPKDYSLSELAPLVSHLKKK